MLQCSRQAASDGLLALVGPFIFHPCQSWLGHTRNLGQQMSNTPHQRIVDPIFIQHGKLFRSLVRHSLICHADNALLVPNHTSNCGDNFGGRFTYRASNTFTGCPLADGADTYGRI
ncbi:hypothetical protein OIDMADRAFT_21650 [Oidiodendron maius Zn]|uniref:Uncharacterized protein n=1 Tax=Oidiodendron maius (strain Zn) TaxID=913774 RepID=A0A0C3CSY1_OIDMZ|nr:hypothetical protein OIDMADRAFT_21650 [Oidiodendron maius Zn]